MRRHTKPTVHVAPAAWESQERGDVHTSILDGPASEAEYTEVQVGNTTVENTFLIYCRK